MFQHRGGPPCLRSLRLRRHCDITEYHNMQTDRRVAKKAKRRGPKPTGKGVLVAVRCHPEFLAAIDLWRAEQPRQPGQAAGLTRPQAIRWLAELGLRADSGK